MSIEPQTDVRLLEKLDLLSNTTILGTLYGIVVTLYCLCSLSLYRQIREPDLQRQAKFTLGYISLILFLVTAYLGLNARTMSVVYIDHANFPGGALQYEVSLDSLAKKYGIAGGIIDFSVEVLTMIIQVGYG